MRNTRVDDWVEAFVCEPFPNTIPNYWDWLPRELKMCVLLHERHRLARRMIYRMGLAFQRVKNLRFQDYDKLDFTDYRKEFLYRTSMLKRAYARSFINTSINEYICSVTFEVPWLTCTKNVHIQKHHDDGCGFYAHLSWLRWKDRDSWMKYTPNSRTLPHDGNTPLGTRGVAIDLEEFYQRKIRFEGYHLFCGRGPLRRANIFLVDRGCLDMQQSMPLVSVVDLYQ